MKINKKKVTMITALALSVGIIGSLGSYSYFSDRSQVTNDFTTGSMDVKVTESKWKNSEDGKNMYPGYTTEKDPTVQNNTGIVDNDAYVAAFIHVKDHEGNVITDSKRLDLIYHTIRYDATAGGTTLVKGEKYDNASIIANPNVNPAFELQKRDDSTGTWTYYLKERLKSADNPEDGDSATLFTKIAVPTEWSQTELDIMGDFKIEVEYKCIQAATFTDVYDAMKTLLSGDMEIHSDYKEDDSNRSGVDGKTFSDENHSEDMITPTVAVEPTTAPAEETVQPTTAAVVTE